MAASTTTYRDLLAKWYTAMLKRDINSFFIAAETLRSDMHTEYTKLGNTQAFTEWLEAKAAHEARGYEQGQTLFFVGGSDAR